jgi:ATP-dependent DNA ligase
MRVQGKDANRSRGQPARQGAKAAVKSRVVRAPSNQKFGIPLDLPPMEAKLSESLPADGAWQFEPKWDGFRCLAFKAGPDVELRAKSGKPLTRYFPEVAAMLAGVSASRLVVDGELVIEVGDELSFDALQMRLHPAETRIQKLSRETPARFILFDVLQIPSGATVIDQPLSVRRHHLEEFIRNAARPGLALSPYTRDRNVAEGWLREGRQSTDGVVAKRLGGPYEPGERAMIKVKRRRTADCVVGGFRYGSGNCEVGSLLLGLYNEAGKLDHVGFTSTISAGERPALTQRLEALRKPPGFTGKAPGGPSRWSTKRSGEWEPLAPKLVVEVRFRHGTKLVRWRPDKAPRQCTYEQIAVAEAGQNAMLANVSRG